MMEKMTKKFKRLRKIRTHGPQSDQNWNSDRCETSQSNVEHGEVSSSRFGTIVRRYNPWIISKIPCVSSTPKTIYATRNHIKKVEGYNLTAGIMDILMAKPTDYANTEKANIMTDKVHSQERPTMIEEK